MGSLKDINYVAQPTQDNLRDNLNTYLRRMQRKIYQKDERINEKNTFHHTHTQKKKDYEREEKMGLRENMLLI